MKKGTIVVELQHKSFGQVFAVSAGRCDSGHYLICRNYASKRAAPEWGWQKKLLVDGPWLDPQEKVRAAFGVIFKPIHEANLRLLRRGERYDIAHRSRRGAKMPLAGNADDVHELPVELSCRDALDDIVSLSEADDAAAIVLGDVDAALVELRARVAV